MEEDYINRNNCSSMECINYVKIWKKVERSLSAGSDKMERVGGR